MPNLQTTISPVDGSVYAERELADARQIEQTLQTAVEKSAVMEADQHRRAGGHL